MSDEEYLTRSENFVEQNEFLEPQSLPERSYLRKASKTKKSFSHELGPKGGIRPTPVRAHSYSDLRVIQEFLFIALRVLLYSYFCNR